VYEAVLQLAVPAGQVTFFEDVERNVVGARAAEMKAYQVDGVEELRLCLARLGYLPG
jgi:FMN phosphatase YigB (HAD superfamily)